MMTRQLSIAVLTILVLFLSNLAGQVQKPKPDSQIVEIDRYTAEVDRFVKRNEKSARIFADVSSGSSNKSNWKRFRSEREREKADTGENLNQNAYVWTRAGKVVGVNFTFQSPSRDWAHFVMYFYREDGSLAKVHSQLNTFYGNLSIVRDQYYSVDGKLLKSRKKFLDLQTQKTKKQPADFQDEPIPEFKHVSELPFFKLL